MRIHDTMVRAFPVCMPAPLFLTQISHLLSGWAMCERCGETQPASEAWSCATCSFDVCSNCIGGGLLFEEDTPSAACLCLVASTSGAIAALSVIVVEEDDITITFVRAWAVQGLSPIYSQPLLVQSLVVFGSVSGAVRALDASTGAIVWTSTFDRPVFSAPTALCSQDAVVIGCHDGVLRCLNLCDGVTLWEVPLGCAIFSRPCVVADYSSDGSLVLASTTAGSVHLMRVASPAVGHVAVPILVGKVELPAECFCSPLLWNNDATNVVGPVHACFGARNDRIYFWNDIET
jgi:outer membrane protein assembly factor BamB